MSTAAAGRRTPAPRPRVVAIDVIRGLAIIGMIWAHARILVEGALPDGLLSAVSALSGAATPLFMFTAGSSIALLTAQTMGRAERSRFRLEYALRGLALILLGLALSQTTSHVDVVLSYLGMTFLAALPFLFLRSRWLLVSAALVFAAAPPAVDAVRALFAGHPALLNPQVSGHPLAYVLEWLFTGRAYHVTWLLPFLLVGIVLSRHVRNSGVRCAALTAGGLVVTVIAWVLVGRQDAAGGMVRGGYPEMLYDLGRALAVYGAAALLVDSRAARLRRGARVLCAPLTLVGRMPLTIYVLHVPLLTWFLHALPGMAFWQQAGTAAHVLVLLLFFAVCLLFAAAWGLTLGTGPVERVLGVVSLRHPPAWALLVRPVRAEGLGVEATDRDGQETRTQRGNTLNERR
ncbi:MULTISPECIES: acyltransferase family protein [Brevibacterium]|uniref:Acyltransferase 3 domain-containing protein n=1 Tax=Brevibacterium salitolerans TaxID=1403566 RepID=A0ABN2WRD9_9MICO|nr:acyltransferase family protein [Brevibacterium sp.]